MDNNNINNNNNITNNNSNNSNNHHGKRAQALWDYDGEKVQNNLLSFKRGETIKIVESNDTNWWIGTVNGKTGFFPVNYTQQIIDLSEMKKTVKSIINTVFKQEALYGLNELKEAKVQQRKRNSLPQSLKEDEIMEVMRHSASIIGGNNTNNNTSSLQSYPLKSMSLHQTIPISFSKKMKKKTILPKMLERTSPIVEEEESVEFQYRDIRRSFSDPCINPNDPLKIKWRNTDVEQTMQVLTDIKSEDGRIVFRIKEQGNLTLKSIRSGTIEAILEYFVMCLACDDEEHSKIEGFTRELDSLKEEIKFFFCAHQRVITTDNILNIMHKLHNDEVMPPPLPTNREGMDRFIGEYNSLKEKKQLGVYNLLSFWIQNSYYPDFVLYDGNPTSSVAKLHNFARSLPKHRKLEILQKINHQLPYIVLNKSNSDPKKFMKLKPLPEFAIEINFMDLDNREVAESLTRIDADMMRKITRGEFLYKHFENLKKELPNSNYIKYAERLRKLSLWVSSQIVREGKKKMRAKVYKKLVQIAQMCLELNNLSSLCAILAGVGSAAVRRLTETIKEVPHEVKLIVKEMEENFMGFSDSVSRNLIKTCIDNKKPCIPTIDLIRTDLLRIDEGSKGDYTKHKDHIKFFKIVSFGKAIHFIEQAYSHPFHFEGNSDKRTILVDEFLTLLPNTFKQKQVLMKFSFEAEGPSERERKTGKYKDFINESETK